MKSLLGVIFLPQSKSTTNTSRRKGKIMVLFLGMAAAAGIVASLGSFHTLPPRRGGGHGLFNKASTTSMFLLSTKTRSVETRQSPPVLHRNPPWEHALPASLSHFRRDFPLSKELSDHRSSAMRKTSRSFK